jgi:Tfp pilus assembly protein PilO
MFKALTPIIGIIVAVGLFFTYVRPTFEEVRGIQDDTAEYAQAIDKASELQRRIDELKAQQSSISLANLERLEALLPDRVDEVSTLIDLSTLAEKHHLVFGDINIGGEGKNTSGTKGKTGTQTTPSGQPVSASAPVPAASGAPAAGPASMGPEGMPADGGQFVPAEPLSSQYSTLEIGFSVTGTYDDFRAFLADVERSLVLMEVTKISFSSSEGDAIPFSVTVRLYSLNPPTP